MLIANPKGRYHFLRGIDPYSCGVIADAGREIVHVTLRHTAPWRQGFDLIDAHLATAGCTRWALCAVQLRCPEPYTIDAFKAFNRVYCQLLRDWDLYVGDLNPVARTNVAPACSPPQEPSLFAFSYVTAAAHRDLPQSVVIAGAGELREGVLVAEGIVRRGDRSPAAMREKAAYVMKAMEERLLALGSRWSLINQVNVYTAHLLEGLVEDIVLDRLGPARHMGVHWHQARPPVLDIEFEMDMRGVHRELIL